MSGLAQFLVGHVLNERYRLDSVLGQGGFGVVFHAVDLQRGDREVAVKVLDPPRGMTAGDAERLRHRFRREAMAASRLPMHPNLVPVLDYGADARVDFLVMELLRGESLRERLARPAPLSLRTALHVLLEAARGVAVGHESGIVHRDLKPANVFLEGEGREPGVRVLDFGIAKALDEGEDEETRTHLTLPGEWFGSEFYSPPEHLRGEPVTRAADVFSLGVVAFEVLTRTRLYTRDDQNRRRAGLPVPVPSLVARNAAVPQEVEWIVRRALMDDPAQRWEDAGALAAELHRAVGLLRRADDHASPAGGETTTGRRVEDSDDATVAAAPATTGRRAAEVDVTGLTGEIEKLRWRRMKTLAVRAAGVLILCTGGVMGGMALADARQLQSPRPAPARILSAAEENEAGLRRFRAGEFGSAAEAFARAVQKAPGHAEYQNNHAYALLRAGRVDEAVRELQEVVAQHPAREVAYSNLAEAQLVQGDTAAAITTMHALLSMSPSPPRRGEAQAFLARLGADRWDTAEWNDPTVVSGGSAEPGYWEDGSWTGTDVTTDTMVTTLPTDSAYMD